MIALYDMFIYKCNWRYHLNCCVHVHTCICLVFLYLYLLLSINWLFSRIIGLDLVVRDDDGNIIDADSTGVIELYRRVRQLLSR
jgi:hypothetical protein